MSQTSTTPAATEPTPTPPPASELRASAPRVGAREAMQIIRDRRSAAEAAATLEAGELYAGDDDGARELEDIKAGRHPLQRGGQNLDAWPKFEAKLAAIRARRGA
jgi:hypothetical protein